MVYKFEWYQKHKCCQIPVPPIGIGENVKSSLYISMWYQNQALPVYYWRFQIFIFCVVWNYKIQLGAGGWVWQVAADWVYTILAAMSGVLLVILSSQM